MNLHGLVRNVIGAINPHRTITMRKSDGYTTNADGSREPKFIDITGEAQVQSLNSKELQHMEGLNINGVLAKVYLYGEFSSVVRVGQQGGDLLIFNNSTWLVVNQLESWPDWCCVIVQQQMDETSDCEC